MGLACLCALAVASGGRAPVAAAGTCPNEAFRVGPSATLPDCRAYEQVSPVDKNGYNSQSGYGAASSSGAGYAWAPPNGAAFPGSAGNTLNVYAGSRTSSGWGLDPLIPLSPFENPTVLDGFRLPRQFSPDLSSMLAWTADALNPQDENWAGGGTGQDWYRRNADGSWTWMSRGSAGTCGYGAWNWGATDDLRWVAFCDTGSIDPQHPVTPGASEYLYLSDGQTPRLVGILPDGQPAPFAAIGNRPSSGEGSSFRFVRNAISPDGSRVVFNSVDPGVTSSRNLWLRIGDETRLLSRFEATGEPTESRVNYEGATWGSGPDEGTVFFATESDLLGGHPEGGVYAYDVATDSLSFLAPATFGGDHVAGSCATRPNRCSGVLTISDDGRRVYFATTVRIDGAGLSEKPNLYVLDRAANSTTYIGTLAGYLDSGGGNDTEGSPDALVPTAMAQEDNVGKTGNQPVEASPGSGRFLVFASKAKLTSFDNEGFVEIYRYDAVEDSLICVSCGARPVVANSVLGATKVSYIETGMGEGTGKPRYVSQDGSYVFFNSLQGIVPEDTNGTVDAYVWHDGKISLLSTGAGSAPSSFLSASADGHDAYFETTASLVPQDEDSLFDIYDARIGGGLASQYLRPGDRCGGETCQGMPAGVEPGPGTASRDIASTVAAKSRRVKRHKQARQRRQKARRHCRKKGATTKRCARHRSSKRGGNR